MDNAHHKSSAINIRIQPHQKALIDKAAAVLHRNRSDFMLEAACLAAENTLLDQRLFLLDNASWNAFEKILNTPSRQSAIDSILSSKSPWEK